MLYSELQIALDEKGHLVSIFNVASGLACNCFCPVCKKPLVAKNKGKSSNDNLEDGQKIAHFAHYDGSSCVGAMESSVHKIAKEVLLQNKALLLPPFYLNFDEICGCQHVNFDEVQLESSVFVDKTRIQPDAILIKNGKKLFVEFCYTHGVDDKKLNLIEQLNISCIEIYLSDFIPVLENEINYAGMKFFLEEISSNRIWLYNAKHSNKKTDYPKPSISTQPHSFLNRSSVNLDSNSNATNKIDLDSRILIIIKNLENQGYRLIKVYEFAHYEYDSYSSESGYSKTFKRFINKEEYLFCPLMKRNGNKDRLFLHDCKHCQFHKQILKRSFNIYVACGYNLK